MNRKFIQSLLLLALLFFIDLFFLPVPLIAFFSLGALLIIFIPAAIYRRFNLARKKHLENSAEKSAAEIKYKAAIARLVFWGQLIILNLGVFGLNLWHANYQAKNLIAACEQYRTVAGTYPAQLELLVPNYLTRLPRPKILALMNRFQYFQVNQKTILLWVSIPPFGRRQYCFEDKKWGYLD